MEEKERYSLEEFDDIDWELAVVDNKLGKSLTFKEIKNLLNQLDKHIKELEEQIKTKDTINNLYKATISLRDGDFKDLVYENNELKQENQQLKEEVIYQKNYVREEWKTQNNFLNEIKQLKQTQKQLTINELERVNRILTDTIIEVTQNEMNIDKLAYLEEISASFGQKINDRIKSLEKKLKEDMKNE